MDTLALQTPRSTRAAEGVPRWRWTTADLVRLAELGAFTDTDRFELFGGEIIPMSPTSRRHELIREAIAIAWTPHLAAANVWVSQEPQFNLDDDTYTKPDLLVRPFAIKMPDVRGPDSLLIVEVAHTSLRKDTGWKRDVYAQFGVREYWVIDAGDLSVRRHLDPVGGSYLAVTDHVATETVVPAFVPALTLRMSDLDVV